MTDNPYVAPEAAVAPPVWSDRAFVSLLAFAASVVLLPLVFVVVGGASRSPAFLLKPGFIFTLLACAAVSVLALRPFRSAHWLVHVLLSPIITFVLLVIVIVLLRLVAT